MGVKDLKVSVTHEEYRSYVADLGAEVLSIAQQSQNYIKGTITLRQKRVLFLSIPYDSGWMIRVDGKKIKPYILNIGFMGFPLEPGKHTVELQYRSPWLIAGGMVSLAGIFLYFFLIRGFRKMSSNSIPE